MCVCDLLKEFGDANIICNGDFNARTANYQVNQDFVQNYENYMADRDVWVQSNLARQPDKRLWEKTPGAVSIVWSPVNNGKFTFISDQG